MKKLLALAALFILILAGCENAFAPEQSSAAPAAVTVEEPSQGAQANSSKINDSKQIESPAQNTSAEPIQGLSSQKCYDTDGSVNIRVKGTVTEGSLTGTDYCEGTGSVNEYSCADGHIYHQIIPCGLNRECQDGACVQSTTTVVVQTNRYDDCSPGQTRCDASDALYLDGCTNGQWTRAGRCPDGCLNNECVPEECYGPGTRCNYDNTSVETCNTITGKFQLDQTCMFGCDSGKCK